MAESERIEQLAIEETGLARNCGERVAARMKLTDVAPALLRVYVSRNTRRAVQHADKALEAWSRAGRNQAGPRGTDHQSATSAAVTVQARA